VRAAALQGADGGDHISMIDMEERNLSDTDGESTDMASSAYSDEDIFFEL